MINAPLPVARVWGIFISINDHESKFIYSPLIEINTSYQNKLRTKTITKNKKLSCVTGTYAPYKFCRTFGARYKHLAAPDESGGLHPRLYSRGPSARCLTNFVRKPKTKTKKQ